MSTATITPRSALELTGCAGPTVLARTTERWRVHDLSRTGLPNPPALPAPRPRSLLHARGEQGTSKKKASRYERFTTWIIVISSAIVLSITASLHVFNYSLETKTSSTSGSHTDFYTTQAETQGK